MSSKLYNTYISLKIQSPYKKYLFKIGYFYYFLDEDAKELSRILNLKLGHLNADIVKCGFPINSLNKYMKILKQYGYAVKIVDRDYNIIFDYKDFKLNNKIVELLKQISSLKVDSLSISEAYDTLQNLKQRSTKILEGIQNEEKK